MIPDAFWPPHEAFRALSVAGQINDGAARCTGVAVCDDDGHPTRQFHQGQRAHVFYEFDVSTTLAVSAGGVEFCDERGWIVHGKNGFQCDGPLPSSVDAGMRLRCHSVVSLEVATGEYWLTVGLASVARSAYQDYRQGRLPHPEFARLMREHCRVQRVGNFMVEFAADGKLLHHGAANLPGYSSVTVQPSASPSPGAIASAESHPDLPTVFHVTHWRAGSQWLYKILAAASPGSIVKPEPGNAQFLHWPLRAGRVYPSVYVTKQDFDAVPKPAGARHFVVIRDLRDTLVSAYFSAKFSHPILDSDAAKLRRVLQSTSFEDGMVYMMDEWLPECARIQTSWLESGEPLIRYCDLLDRDAEILQRVLVDECRLPVDHQRLRHAILTNRFEQLTGRPRGLEDVTAHERKGVAGDWKNHFDNRLKRAFKARFGGLLVATGFERDLAW
ncbi:MAG TPA: Wzt carbohydrate-binding domain-containing protein [Verrucomicrobiae bacterium]|nr:Wzt carbohydrate-binding domain-containing protein [Verrucomicrobiae bacterium]